MNKILRRTTKLKKVNFNQKERIYRIKNCLKKM